MIRNCDSCGQEYEAQRSTSKFCSDDCRYRKNSRASKRRRIPNDIRYRILRRDGFRCRYCGAEPARKELRVDHVVPIAAGGAPLALANLVTACYECNDGKRDTVIDPTEVPDGVVGA